MNHITEETFPLIAAKYYDNPQCGDIEEFYDDLKRFVYIKRMFGRYQKTGAIKERLILNHLIILKNLFGPMTTKFLFFKIDKDYYSYLKPFLVFLGYLPEIIETDCGIINTKTISMDKKITEALKLI